MGSAGLEHFFYFPLRTLNDAGEPGVTGRHRLCRSHYGREGEEREEHLKHVGVGGHKFTCRSFVGCRGGALQIDYVCDEAAKVVVIVSV